MYVFAQIFCPRLPPARQYVLICLQIIYRVYYTPCAVRKIPLLTFAPWHPEGYHFVDTINLFIPETTYYKNFIFYSAYYGILSNYLHNWQDLWQLVELVESEDMVKAQSLLLTSETIGITTD